VEDTAFKQRPEEADNEPIDTGTKGETSRAEISR
jgi:hypothetical protein